MYQIPEHDDMTQFGYISESLAEMNPEALLADGLEEALIGRDT